MYEMTIDNLKQAVRSAGVVHTAALLRFFNDVPDVGQLPFYINQLVRMRVFDYNEVRDRISWHNGPKLKTAVENDRVYAFWVVASFGSNNVAQLMTCDSPTQFLLFTTTNEAYDISVIKSTLDAQRAVIVRRRSTVEGMDDDINHIALAPDLVNDRGLSDTIANCGFDSICQLNENFIPAYSQWERV